MLARRLADGALGFLRWDVLGQEKGDVAGDRGEAAHGLVLGRVGGVLSEHLQIELGEEDRIGKGVGLPDDLLQELLLLAR